MTGCGAGSARAPPRWSPIPRPTGSLPDNEHYEPLPAEMSGPPINYVTYFSPTDFVLMNCANQTGDALDESRWIPLVDTQPAQRLAMSAAKRFRYGSVSWCRSRRTLPY